MLNRHWLRYFIYMLLGLFFYHSNHKRIAFIVRTWNRFTALKSLFLRAQEGVHIWPIHYQGKKWLVKVDGRYQRNFDTKANALPYATKLAKSKRKKLIIHYKNGDIQEKAPTEIKN